MSAIVYTPAYLSDFQCLGPDCIDTCCQSWDIYYAEHHYRLLMNLVADDAKAREFIQRFLIPLSNEQQSDDHYAAIQFKNQRFCPFLDADRWCYLHKHFGIQALNTTCGSFPRVFSRFGQMIEMTGALSCPEVARRCLSSDDHSVWRGLPPAALPQQHELPLAHSIADENLDDYLNGLIPVREVFLKLMLLEEYAIETRLFFLANLCQRLSDFYHRGVSGVMERVEQELARFDDPQVLHTLEEFYDGYQPSDAVAMVIVQAILQWHLQQAPDHVLSAVIKMIHADYAYQLERHDELDIYADNLPPEALEKTYQRHWQTLNASWGVEFERCLTNYLINVVQREWFISMPDPFTYMHLLIVRIAILKFLIVSYPPIQQFIAEHETAQDPRDPELSAAFVELVAGVVYKFARGIDQNHAFLRVVYAALGEQQMLSYDYSLPLIKF